MEIIPLFVELFGENKRGHNVLLLLIKRAIMIKTNQKQRDLL